MKKTNYIAALALLIWSSASGWCVARSIDNNTLGSNSASPKQSALLEAEAYMQQGMKAYEAREFDKAMGYLNKAVDQAQAYHKTYEIRGGLYFDQKLYNLALADAEKALSLNPQSSTAYFLRGGVRSVRHEYDQAIEDFSKSIELNPKFNEAYRERGSAYAKLEKRQEAINDFTKEIEINPHTQSCVYLKRAWQYMLGSEYDKALADYDKAIQLDPAVGHMERGSAYYQMGRYEAALEDFRKAVEKKPDYDYPRLYMLTSAKRLSDDLWRKFLEVQKEHAETKPSTTWSRMLLRFVLGVDSMTQDDLLAEARKAPTPKEVSGRLCEAYYFLGEVSSWRGDEKKAMEYYARSVETGETCYIEYGNAKAFLKMNASGTSR